MVHSFFWFSFHCFLPNINSETCAGIYNVYMGQKKKGVALVYKYMNLGNNKEYCFGSYNWCPSIVAVDCLKISTFQTDSKNGDGLHCLNCFNFISRMVGSKQAKLLQNFEYRITKCLEWRKKKELVPSDFTDALAFNKDSNNMLTTTGLQLKEEVLAQVHHRREYACMATKMKHQSSSYLTQNHHLVPWKTYIMP